MIRLEHGATPAWADGLCRRGYEVLQSPPGDQSFGHARAIQIVGSGMLAGAADPRSHDGACIGLLPRRRHEEGYSERIRLTVVGDPSL